MAPCARSKAAAFLSQAGINDPAGTSAAERAPRSRRRMLNAVLFHSDYVSLSEQFDSTTGDEKSVSNLTWTYAAYVSAVRMRAGAAPLPPAQRVAVQSGRTASPGEIVPLSITSARRPPWWTSPRNTPRSVRDWRWLHGSQSSMPSHTTSPTVKQRPTSAFRSTGRGWDVAPRGLVAELDPGVSLKSLERLGGDQRQRLAGSRTRRREVPVAPRVPCPLSRARSARASGGARAQPQSRSGRRRRRSSA